MKRFVVVLLALCLSCSAASADRFMPITPEIFTDLYKTASTLYSVPPLGEMKVDSAVYNVRYWETEHETIRTMLDLDGHIKTVTVTADLSSRVFLNICFCVLQAMNDHAMSTEEKGRIVEYYFMTSQMPDAGWGLNDHIMYQFTFSDTADVMTVYVN